MRQASTDHGGGKRRSGIGAKVMGPPTEAASKSQAYFEPLEFTTIICPSFLLAPSVDFQAGGTLQSKFKIRQRT